VDPRVRRDALKIPSEPPGRSDAATREQARSLQEKNRRAGRGNRGSGASMRPDGRDGRVDIAIYETSLNQIRTTEIQ
ncbi:hypothetical protein ABTH94_22810, partial [Acinetobacter baumannii]